VIYLQEVVRAVGEKLASLPMPTGWLYRFSISEMELDGGSYVVTITAKPEQMTDLEGGQE